MALCSLPDDILVRILSYALLVFADAGRAAAVDISMAAFAREP